MEGSTNVSHGDRAQQEQDGEAKATFLAKDEKELSIMPERTALLVIDPVNDFLSEGGAAWDLTKTTVKMNSVIEHLKQLIEGARERGVPVLFGPMAYTEDDYATEHLHRRSGINRIMFERKMFLAGSWGADFHPDLQPADEDIVLGPHKGMDVFETDLPGHLERLNCTHLVIAGMTANLCCESTGRRAMEEGYEVIYISDAIGAENVMAYEASIRVNFPMIANAVITTEEFFSSVDQVYEDRSSIHEGDVVRGSDHGKIGPVEQIVGATDEHEAHVMVPRGLVFETETYIPLDAVVKRSEGQVYINMPKMVVKKMPWGEPPTKEDRRAKNGPNAREIQKLYGSRSPSIKETRT